jgi:hypothetical protein
MEVEEVGLCESMHFTPKRRAPMPEILVIGSPGVGKSTLIKAILTASSHPVATGSLVPWNIGTKYYKAEVDFREVTLPLIDPSDAVGALQHQHLAASAEAVVLVFDASQQATYEAVRSWAQHADSAGALEGAQIRLAIAAKVDCLMEASHSHSLAGSDGAAPGSSSSAVKQRGQQVEQRPSWLDSAMEWCCEYSMEYIEGCSAHAELDAGLLLDADVQGTR